VSDVELRIDGHGPDRLVLAHGAGAPMDSPFLTTMAEGLAARSIQVARFEFPYMRARGARGRRGPPDPERVLRATWHDVIERLGGGAGLVIGGKSLGGRMASLVADEAGVRGLVCLGYPFHPAGRPERLRTAHRAALRTPTLIVQGERDALGTRAEIAGYALSPTIRIVFVEDGDHSFAPRSRSGRSHAANLDRAVEAVAGFIHARAR
jgi:predicted alpha/beta-hydrolase family hydrolase